MTGINLSRWTLKEQISDSLKVLKATSFKGFYLPFLMLLIMGGINIALSFYSSLEGLGIILSVFALYFSYITVTESNASYYLKTKKNYPTYRLSSHFTSGELHITSTFFKALLCGILTGFIISLVILGVYYIFDHNLIDNLRQYIDSLNSNSEFIDAIYDEVYPALYIINGSILVMFYFWLSFFHRTIENSFSFSGSQINEDRRFFVLPSIPPRIYSAFSYNYKFRYRIKSSLTLIIDFVILGGGTALGTYIGHLFGFNLPYFSPANFGIGFALILYGLWYGFERAWDVAFFYHYKKELCDNLPENALTAINDMKQIIKSLFPDGRLEITEEFKNLNGIPSNLLTRDAIVYTFLLQYDDYEYRSDDEAVSEIEETESEEKNDDNENDENNDDSGNLGIFGLGD